MADGTSGSGGDGGDIFSTINTRDIKKATESTGKLSDTQRELVDNANELQKQVDANTDSLRDYGRGAADAKRHLETLGEAWNRQADSIKRSTHELLTFNAKVHEAGGALTGFMAKMKEAISLGGVYNRTLAELKTSQVAYVSSLNFSTASYGKASSEHQKYLSAINAANISASTTARKYSLDIKEVQEAQAAVTDAFNTQIGASGKHQKSIESLREQALVFSKTMGVNVRDATDFMRSRLEHSTKTMSEMQVETWRVTAAADAYTVSLVKMGKRARETASINRREFLASIRETSEQFKIGSFDAAAYSQDLGKYLTAAKATGAFSKQEMGMLMKQYSGTITGIQSGKLSSYFQVDAAKEFVRMGLQSTNKEARAKIEHVLKRTGGDIEKPQSLRMLAEASRGTPELTNLIFKSMHKMLSPETFQEMLYKGSGVEFQRGADFLYQQTGTGGALAEGKRTSRADLTKEEQKALQDKIDKMTGAVKEGQKPTKYPWLLALQTRNISQEILNKMKYYYPLMLTAMGAQAVGSIVTGLLTRGAVGKLAGGLLGRGGTASRAVASRAAASRAAAGGLTRAGNRVALRSAGRFGMLKTAGGVLGRVGSKLIPGIGTALAIYEGYKGFKFLDKYVGKQASGSKEAKAMLGADRSVSNMLSIGVASALGGDKYDFLKNIRRTRADNSTSMEKLTKQYDDAAQAVRLHTAGIKPLNAKELEQKKKLIAANEKTVTTHKKFNFEANQRRRKQMGRELVGSTAQAATSVDDWLAGGGRGAWMGEEGGYQLEQLLAGKTVEGTSKEESEDALDQLKQIAKDKNMEWEDFKKQIRERQSVASLKWSAGSHIGKRRDYLQKKLGKDLTGSSEAELLTLWAQNVSKSEAQREGVSLPEEMRKKIEQRMNPSINLSAADINSEAGATRGMGSFHHNPVNDEMTFSQTTVSTITVPGAQVGSALTKVAGTRTPTTTNAPGKTG